LDWTDIAQGNRIFNLCATGVFTSEEKTKYESKKHPVPDEGFHIVE
jgi:hypothetical protein